MRTENKLHLHTLRLMGHDVHVDVHADKEAYHPLVRLPMCRQVAPSN